MRADATPFVPTDDWLDAFETQATPHMFEQVLVYAQTCERLLSSERFVDPHELAMELHAPESERRRAADALWRALSALARLRVTDGVSYQRAMREIVDSSLLEIDRHDEPNDAIRDAAEHVFETACRFETIRAIEDRGISPDVRRAAKKMYDDNRGRLAELRAKKGK
jgi:hypothetical protein